MSLRRRRAEPPPGDWRLRYAVAGMGEPITEIFATKLLVRDRLAVVMKYKGLSLLEVRDSSGAVWFKDHFFQKGEGLL